MVAGEMYLSLESMDDVLKTWLSANPRGSMLDDMLDVDWVKCSDLKGHGRSQECINEANTSGISMILEGDYKLQTHGIL